MFQIILGRAGFGKTHKIREIAKKEILNGNKNVILLVPEQNSFENEREFLRSVGAKFCQNIKILSFTRMANVILEDKQNAALIQRSSATKLDDVGRRILMYRALQQTRNQLKIYKDHSSWPEFVDLMISTQKELKSNTVSAEILLEKSSSVENLLLSEKMKEIGTILSHFESLISETYCDPIDDLTVLRKLLLIRPVFSSYTVLVDGFDFFTSQQLNVLELIIKESKKCYVSLCLNHLDLAIDNLSVFLPTIETMKTLNSAAEKAKVKVTAPMILEKPYRFKSSSLRAIEQNIFAIKSKLTLKNDGNVNICKAQDIYDECDFAARCIKRLVVDEQYNYGDFAVIVRSIDDYDGIIDVTFKEYSIPFFMDAKENICTKPLMRLLLIAFDIICTNFSSEKISEYIKIDYLELSEESSLLLENYIFTWQIKGRDWFDDFKKNPRGFSDKFRAEELCELSIINEARKKIIAPLLELSDSVKTSNNSREISESIYEFLIKLEIPKILRSSAVNLTKDNKIKESNEIAKLWEVIIETLDKMVSFLAEQKIDFKIYVELFKMCISCNEISFIPQRLDEVKIGAIDRIRPENPKIVFVLGAISSSFPRDPDLTGVFSEKDRKNLSSAGVVLRNSLEKLSFFERFLAYKALTCAQNKLFISFYGYDSSGKECTESIIVDEVKNSLTDLIVTRSVDISLEDGIWSKNKALEFYAEYKNKSGLSGIIRSILIDDAEYQGKIKALERAFLNTNKYSISSENSSGLFRTPMVLSATQIEQYNSCSFKYFCTYGIAIKKRKPAKFTSLEYGGLLHFLMEKIFLQCSIEELASKDERAISQKIDLVMSEYKKIKLGIKNFHSVRFDFLFSRIQKFSRIMVNSIVNELMMANFTPMECELILSATSQNKLTKPLEIRQNKNLLSIVEGRIDRLDVLEIKGQKLLRVVDYKLPQKKISLSNIVNGFDMQMPIYLLAIAENLKGKFVPSAMLYTQLKVPISDTIKNIKDKAIKELNASGLILKEYKDVVAGPQKRTSRTFNFVDASEMNSLFNFVKRSILDIIFKIRQGNFQASPVKKGCNSACDFCEFHAVCRHEKGLNEKIVKEKNQDEISKILNSYKQ
ncbi:MAG: PD-(D/E)XK nuclease family protein [Oscillospiraceae bacterium]|nr:PD-(D/E)XK nuclease family protein [Oscillospiraceae bacterium]